MRAFVFAPEKLMRICLLFIIVSAFPALTFAQAGPLPWPEITMTTCPDYYGPPRFKGQLKELEPCIQKKMHA